jgi:hypothetical protein
MYTTKNFKSKKALREAVKAGEKITLFAPGLGTPVYNGVECVEGPHFPKAHSWYAEVVLKDGVIILVK